MIEEEPQAPFGWYAKGQVFLHMKDSGKALKCLERALNTSCQLSEDVKEKICNSLKRIASLHIEAISQKVVGRIGFDIYKHKTEFLNSIESLEKRIIEVCSSGILLAEDITRFFPVWVFNSISDIRKTLLERKKKFEALLSIDNNYISLKKSIEMCIDIAILFVHREQNISNKIKGYKMLIDWTDALISMTQFIPINNGKLQYKRAINFCNLERKKAIQKRKMIISSLEEIDYSEAAEYRERDKRIKVKKVLKRTILILFIVLLFACYSIGSQLKYNYKTMADRNEDNIVGNTENSEMENVKTEVDNEEISTNANATEEVTAVTRVVPKKIKLGIYYDSAGNSTINLRKNDNEETLSFDLSLYRIASWGGYIFLNEREELMFTAYEYDTGTEVANGIVSYDNDAITLTAIKKDSYFPEVKTFVHEDSYVFSEN